MAAISKVLADSLDGLAKSISKAEEYFASSFPVAPDVYVVVERKGPNEAIEVLHSLEYRADKGLVKTIFNQTTRKETVHPLMEMPIPEREKFARRIPELIEKAIESRDKLPLIINETSNAILEAIKNAKTK